MSFPDSSVTTALLQTVQRVCSLDVFLLTEDGVNCVLILSGMMSIYAALTEYLTCLLTACKAGSADACHL